MKQKVVEIYNSKVSFHLKTILNKIKIKVEN